MKRIVTLLLVLSLLAALPLQGFAVSMVNPPDAEQQTAEAEGLHDGLLGTLGDADLEGLISGIRQSAGDTSGMTDEELRTRITGIASRLGVTLTESQVSQILAFLRSLEGLDAEHIASVISDLKDKAQKLTETAEKAVGFLQKVKGWIDSVAEFFASVKHAFGLE